MDRQAEGKINSGVRVEMGRRKQRKKMKTVMVIVQMNTIIILTISNFDYSDNDVYYMYTMIYF